MKFLSLLLVQFLLVQTLAFQPPKTSTRSTPATLKSLASLCSTGLFRAHGHDRTPYSFNSFMKTLNLAVHDLQRTADELIYMNMHKSDRTYQMPYFLQKRFEVFLELAESEFSPKVSDILEDSESDWDFIYDACAREIPVYVENEDFHGVVAGSWKHDRLEDGQRVLSFDSYFMEDTYGRKA